MTQFYKNGDMYTIVGKERGHKVPHLPAETFVVKHNPMMGFYVDKIEDFDLPKKVYGDVKNIGKRILNTYDTRPKNTGVLLAGDKGSGKTLLAKSISIEGRALGYPTLVVNQPFSGDGFNEFMQAIQQPCVVFMDEFEKIYDDDAQVQMLTLLDGVFTTKKLFLLTCNDKYKVNDFMHNRPSRIFYQLSYDGLDIAFVEEYAEDNLVDKNRVQELVQIASLFQRFNFDILSSLIEEMNRYNESAVDALRYLNAQVPEDYSEYTVTLFIDEVEQERCSTRTMDNPLASSAFSLMVEPEYGDIKDHHERMKLMMAAPRYHFTSKDMVSFNAKEGKIIYFNKEKNATAVFERIVNKDKRFAEFSFGDY